LIYSQQPVKRGMRAAGQPVVLVARLWCAQDNTRAV
jgi:hypothetical protein